MSVNVSSKQVRIRAAEAGKKTGLTFRDLCELVDHGRENNVDLSTPVLGDQWIKHTKDRDGYVLKYIEV